MVFSESVSVERRYSSKHDYNLAGKFAIEDNFKQAKFVFEHGFKRYELYTSFDDIKKKNLSKTKAFLKKIREEYGGVCVSIHSPRGLRKRPVEKSIECVRRCQRLSNYLEELQGKAPVGVVIHEFICEGCDSLKDTLAALKKVYASSLPDVNVLLEVSASSFRKDFMGLTPFPKYIPVFLEELKSFSNFGVCFDFKHVFNSVFFQRLAVRSKDFF